MKRLLKYESALCRWEASGNLPGMTRLYLDVMDALYAINTNTLFFVEGAPLQLTFSSELSGCWL